MTLTVAANTRRKRNVFPVFEFPLFLSESSTCCFSATPRIFQLALGPRSSAARCSCTCARSGVVPACHLPQVGKRGVSWDFRDCFSLLSLFIIFSLWWSLSQAGSRTVPYRSNSTKASCGMTVEKKKSATTVWCFLAQSHYSPHPSLYSLLSRSLSSERPAATTKLGIASGN